jgi:RNA polymerase sigma-70 factor, ECF subfamily
LNEEEHASAKRSQQAEFLALAGELRPELHRYCARLTGSVLEGEDVVQDTFVRALAALPDLDEATPLKPWIFRIAHNRALDVLRGNAIRMTETIDTATNVSDMSSDPLESLMRREAVAVAVSRFVELPVLQRSAVILKDVLDQSLVEIAVLLDVSVDAVKGLLARGRARLREVSAAPTTPPNAPSPTASTARYVALFNQRDWDALRALLTEDVKLVQSAHPPLRGRADVGQFFTMYGKCVGIWLVPAWLERREVIAVYENRADPRPSYFMWLEWRESQISFIRDYRYLSYVVDGAEIGIAPQAALSDECA